MANKKQHTDIYGDTRKLNKLPFLLGGDSINKREKEAQQVFLDNEKAILKQLEQNYEDALAEINDKIAILMGREDAELQHVIYQINYQKALKKQVSAILDKLHANEYESISEYLAKSYEDGFITTMYNLQGQGIPLVIPIDQQQVVEAIQTDSKISTDLYTALGKDISKLKKQISGEISRGISNAAMYSEIAKNLSLYARIGKNNAHRIVRTEMHRIQNKAAMDACWKAKANGADVVRQWDSALDGKTRDSHRELDGQIRELDEEFEVNGHTAMFPGGFGRPEEDINCRCALLQRARWALGNDYTKWSADAPIEIADDGTSQLAYIKAKNYKEFKEQYNQASERVRSNVQKINETVVSLKEVTIGNDTYKVDGKHVILDNTKNEKEIANIISKELGKQVQMVPRIVYPQGISTPDYIIDGKKFDLKEPIGSGKNVLYNMVHKKKSQANNFIFDVSKCPLDQDVIIRQAEELYISSHTAFIDEIIIIKDGKVIKKYKRKE